MKPLMIVLIVGVLGIIMALILAFPEFFSFLLSEKIVNEKIFVKAYRNSDHSKCVSVVLHIKDASHDEFTTTYIIPHFIDKNEIPISENFLLFPDGSGIYLEWFSQNELNIYSSKPPVQNYFEEEDIKIFLIVSREIIDELENDGKKVIWNKIES